MTYEEFSEKYNITLNPQQKEAALATKGPVLLLAVPGSGKTTTLVTRAGYMMFCEDIPSDKMLMLTYTVAAANDMKARFIKMFGEDNGVPEFRTINGVCARILNEYCYKQRTKELELITNEGYLSSIISSIWQETEDTYPAESDLKDVKTKITYIKNMMLNEADIDRLAEDCEYNLKEIYLRYVRYMVQEHKMDFDDQMVYTYRILRSDKEMLETVKKRYPYICVDEAQDTSKIQHFIIRLFAGRNGNLFMVGDEDQSIYGFRAAYPDALLSFEDTYDNAKILLMEENYRSDANITQAADKFIQKNTLRHEKHIKPTHSAKKDIQFIPVTNRAAQYRNILEVAENCNIETAVLFRNNDSAVPIVDLLDRKNVSFNMRGRDLNFFTGRVVTDIVDIMKFALDLKNTEIFKRIYFKFDIYLKKFEVETICDRAIKENEAIPAAIVGCSKGLPGWQADKRFQVAKHLRKLSEKSPLEAIRTIQNQLGYSDYLKRSHISPNHLDVLEELAVYEISIQDFITRLYELNQIICEKTYEKDCLFTLGTMHSSKGLEYDRVYLADVVDGTLPAEKPDNLKTASAKEIGLYEEERRLFYVAMTRAKKELYLYDVKSLPSSFVTEVQQDNKKDPPLKAKLKSKARKKVLAKKD